MRKRDGTLTEIVSPAGINKRVAIRGLKHLMEQVGIKERTVVYDQSQP